MTPNEYCEHHYAKAFQYIDHVLTGKVVAGKLLDTNFMPYYMHKKLQLILKHSNVLIDGIAYIREEAYEILKGDRRYPLKRAQCYLTEKDSLRRNVI